MNKRCGMCWVLLLTFSGALLVCAAAPPPAVVGEEKPSIAELKTFLLPNKSKYLVGEPVFLRLVFANWTEKYSFNLQGFLHPANDFEVRIARARELPRRYMGGLRREALVPSMNVNLRPRELTAVRSTLCYDPDTKTGFLFEQPGEYTLSCMARMTVNQVPQNLVLEETTIIIVEPPADQRKAFDTINSPACAQDLQSLQLRKETSIEWRNLVERFPKSVWAPYARMFQVRQTLDSGPQDYKVLWDEVQAIARTYPDFPLLDDVYYLHAMIQDRMGHPRETLSWLCRLQREYPTSSYIIPTNRLFRKYLYQEGWEGRYAAWFVRE